MHLLRVRNYIYREEGELSVKGICKALGCLRHPELASYLTCFAGDRGFKDSDFSSFNVANWYAFAQQYVKEGGVEPHPAIVASGCR